MEFGLFGINNGALAEPDAAVRVAQAAEAAGFDSVWTGEHVVLPDPQQPPSPAPPGLPMLDPAVSLAYLAAHTSTIALATGIIILPQRNPLVLAKELASVDVVSKGRLWFGYAAGYLHQEFAALGISFDDRGARCDEYLEAMLELWDSESPTFTGETVRFSGIDAHPRPVQRPHPRLIVGGQSAPALRRAVRRANGWYGFAMSPEVVARCVDGLRRARAETDRPESLGELELTVTPPPGPVDAATVDAYRQLGVARLVMLPRVRGADDMIRFVDETAEAHLP
ncbi:MAG: LLM class F420-dependent oxidoreductase [Acidimicrobiales bacterium]